MHPQSDRNLLFGVLAVQMNFVSQDDFVAGIQSWVSDKDKSLGDILRAQGKLTADQVAALDVVITQHLKAYGNDAERGLRALSGASSVATAITPIDDADVQAVLAKICDSTVSYHSPYQPARYRKVQLHREGGQGQIFLAEDTELHRRVALKEIKPKYADELDTRQRFLLEAEITGNLQHPGIVPVYGLGAYPDGKPYYAMRFISDERLSDAIADYHGPAGQARDAGEQSVRFRQLLRRFIDVCNTIAYAHDRGVIHRDLKPGNVMLGKFGETLVIDWGMVKSGVDPRKAESITDEPPVQPVTDVEIDATQQGMIKGTYRYMSPEQADGRIDLIGKPSDIYSLGATLYEVLAGRPAFSASAKEKAQAEAEIRAKVMKGQFAAPIGVNGEVPSGLNAICLKAMALKPSDRYATALALAVDIEHWLADEPVSAYAEPLTARIGRWGRRHRSIVAGTGAALVVAVIALATSTGLIWAEQRETAKQKKSADDNYVLARDQFLNSVGLIEAADVHFASDPALHPKRKELLKTALQACRDFKGAADDADFLKRAATVYRFSANVHRMSDETEAAEPLYADAVRLYDGLAERFPDDVASSARLAETLRDQSTFFIKIGRLREANANLNRAEKWFVKARKNSKQHRDPQLTDANLLLNRAFIAHRLGEKGAVEKTEQAIAILEKLSKQPAGTAHPYTPLLLIASMNQLAVLHREAGDLKKARETHLVVVKRVDELPVKDAAGIAPADYFNINAQCALEQGRTLARYSDEQSRKFAEVKILGPNAQIWKSLAANYSWIPHYRDQQAIALQTRGQLRLVDNRTNEAKKDFEESRQLLEKLAADHPQVADYHADLGRTLAGLARAETDKDAASRARAGARTAWSKAVELAPDDVTFRKEYDGLPK